MTKIDKITSERVRRAITGSATPAHDILDLEGLTSEELQQAGGYFTYCGGIHSAAAAESRFVVEHGC